LYSYPYLTVVNSVLPAILAGNAVLLKPSPQTPLTAERFARAFRQTGLPQNVLQVVHMSPELTSHAIGNPSVNFVSFTGSVAGGRSVAKAAAEAKGFTGVALEVLCINRILRYNPINLISLAEKTPRTLG
jgi:acyl-CoA reductase-like NAD-dependent aldehyde dehydrogenase